MHPAPLAEYVVVSAPRFPPVDSELVTVMITVDPSAVEADSIVPTPVKLIVSIVEVAVSVAEVGESVDEVGESVVEVGESVVEEGGSEVPVLRSVVSTPVLSSEVTGPPPA